MSVTYNNRLLQLLDHFRADQMFKHIFKGIVQMRLKNWQALAIDYLCKKPVPVFAQPLGKEMLPNVKSKPSLKQLWTIPTALFPQNISHWIIPTEHSQYIMTAHLLWFWRKRNDAMWNVLALGAFLWWTSQSLKSFSLLEGIPKQVSWNAEKIQVFPGLKQK